MGRRHKPFDRRLFKDVFKKNKTFMINRARRAFESSKEKLIAAVESHPVSRELRGGTYPSAYLSGASGTLFGFLGFKAGEDPVGDLVRFLDREVRFEYGVENSRQIVKVAIRLPNKGDFSKRGEFTLKGWGAGKSWPVAIETGLSGLPYYLGIKGEKGKSRSLEGFQAKNKKGKLNKVRFTEFKGVHDYLSQILADFKERVRPR